MSEPTYEEKMTWQAGQAVQSPEPNPLPVVELLSQPALELARSHLGQLLLGGMVSQGWTFTEARRRLQDVLDVPHEWKTWVDKQLRQTAAQLWHCLRKGVCPARLYRDAEPLGLGLDLWQLSVPAGAGEVWAVEVPQEAWGCKIGPREYLVLGSFLEDSRRFSDELGLTIAGRITGNTPMVAPFAAEPR